MDQDQRQRIVERIAEVRKYPPAVRNLLDWARLLGASGPELQSIARDGICGGPSCQNPKCPGFLLTFDGSGDGGMVDRCDDCYEAVGIPPVLIQMYGVPAPSPITPEPEDLEDEVPPIEVLARQLP